MSDYLSVGHWHIGSNMPGYLPESDVFCADNIKDAVNLLIEELVTSQDLMDENCEAQTPEQREKMSACCTWCSEYWDLEAVISSGRSVEYDLQARVLKEQGYTYLHTPPVGANLVFWINRQKDVLDACEIHHDQEGTDIPEQYQEVRRG